MVNVRGLDWQRSLICAQFAANVRKGPYADRYTFDLCLIMNVQGKEIPVRWPKFGVLNPTPQRIRPRDRQIFLRKPRQKCGLNRVVWG